MVRLQIFEPDTSSAAAHLPLCAFPIQCAFCALFCARKHWRVIHAHTVSALPFTVNQAEPLQDLEGLALSSGQEVHGGDS